MGAPPVPGPPPAGGEFLRQFDYPQFAVPNRSAKRPLRLKPYCLEGLVTTGMYLDADDQSLAKRELVGNRCLHRGTTLLARGGAADKDEHALLIDVEVALRRKPDGPTPGTAVAERAYLLHPCKQGLIGVDRGEIEHSVGRETLEAAQRAGTRKRRAHDLDVLLRNKRSPRLQGWFERDVLPESLELTNQAPR